MLFIKNNQNSSLIIHKNRLPYNQIVQEKEHKIKLNLNALKQFKN